MADNSSCNPLHGGAVTNSSIVQRSEAAGLIESCRAHASSMAELAEATSRGLSGGYHYEEIDPYLHECCGLVRRVLQQTEAVLSALGVVSLEESRANIGAGCLDQEQWLTGSAHTVRAMIAILRSVEPNDHSQILPALGDLEGGIWMLVDGLKAIAEERVVPDIHGASS